MLISEDQLHEGAKKAARIILSGFAHGFNPSLRSEEESIEELARVIRSEMSRTGSFKKYEPEEIEAHRTARGGFTKEGLSSMGVSWPPFRGWRKRLLRGENPNTLK